MNFLKILCLLGFHDKPLSWTEEQTQLGGGATFAVDYRDCKRCGHRSDVHLCIITHEGKTWGWNL